MNGTTLYCVFIPRHVEGFDRNCYWCYVKRLNDDEISAMNMEVK